MGTLSVGRKTESKNKAYKGGHFEKKENQSFMSRLSVFVRGNFFIPDARKFWVNPSAEYLKDFLQKENIDTIVTSGPPHSLHLIGLKLKNNYQISNGWQIFVILGRKLVIIKN